MATEEGHQYIGHQQIEFIPIDYCTNDFLTDEFMCNKVLYFEKFLKIWDGSFVLFTDNNFSGNRSQITTQAKRINPT